MFRHTYL